nr:MAG TPA: hypothetical protein [Caudoviricetes sp.]
MFTKNKKNTKKVNKSIDKVKILWYNVSVNKW